MAATVTGASLAGILNRLNNTPRYYPADAETFSDWSLEAGDLVGLTRGGTQYTVPVQNANLVWRGASQIGISSPGSIERDPISKVSKRKYGRSGAGMTNERGIWSFVYNSESTMYSYIDQTASYIQMGVEDLASSMGSALLITKSEIRSEVHAANSMLYSYIDETATSITSHVEDVENRLGSEILQTATQIRMEVHASNSLLYSYVDQTATSITSHVEDVESSLSSEIRQTSSQIRIDMNAANSALYSYVDYTATGIRQTVANTASNLQSSINQQAGRIDLVVEGTGANQHIKPAQIQAAIDADNQSLINISADKIKLDGDTTLSGKLTIEDGRLKITGNAFINGDLTLAENKEVSATYYRVGGSIRFPGAQQASDIYIGRSDVENMIISASIDPDTHIVTLTPKTGQPITFRKAAPGGEKISGSWSGATLTVGKSETGSDTFATTISTGLVTDSTVPSALKYHFTAYRQDNDAQYPTELQSARLQYTLGVLSTSKTTVRILNPAGTAYIPGSASYTIPLTTLNVTSRTGDYSPSGDNVGYSSVHVAVPSELPNVRIQFGGASGSSGAQYYIEAFDSVSGSSISDSRLTYKLGTLAETPTIVRILNAAGTAAISNAAMTYSIPLQTKSVTGNGPVTPDTGYVGMSSVDVAIVPRLNGDWSGAKLTVSSTPAALSNFTTTIGDMFVKDGNKYYVSATKDGTELTTTRRQIALGKSGSNIVITDGAQNPTVRPNTPSIALTLDTGTLNTGTGERTVTVNAGGVATTCKATISDYGDGYSTGHSEGYDEGYADGEPTGVTLGTKVTGDVWNASIQRKTGDPVASTISLTAAYTDARAGYYSQSQYNTYGQQKYIAGVNDCGSSAWLIFSNTVPSSAAPQTQIGAGYVYPAYKDASGNRIDKKNIYWTIAPGGITLDTLNASNRTTYNAPAGHAYNVVNVTVPTGLDASNVLLGSYRASTEKPSDVGTYQTLDDLTAMLRTYRNTYIWIKATISGGTGAKWYRLATPS